MAIEPIPAYALSMRNATAALVAVVALGGAVYFGSLHLGATTACTHRGGGVLDLLNCARPSRAVWQFPIAVGIAALGLVGAVGGLRRP